MSVLTPARIVLDERLVGSFGGHDAERRALHKVLV
jgi:hypothetical protein